MFSKVTRDIKVTAVPTFLNEHSEPSDGHYVWAYTIQLENHGSETVQLLNRYWQITDEQGLTQEVRGPGVIGETPVIEPGKAFQYTSGTSLNTPSGIMLGAYEMVNTKGEHFDVDIPAFSLDCPFKKALVN
ncbi:MAG: Co2+/Mg2+ efflux protein ApaG [Alphaproteobacteria bacterium]|nr:Co2+/Mg2+ efflux protein ApaG [Alphaproteobacteria bacterium]